MHTYVMKPYVKLYCVIKVFQLKPLPSYEYTSSLTLQAENRVAVKSEQLGAGQKCEG